MVDNGELKVFNPSKEISREIILDIVIRHRDAMKQARTGERPNSSGNPDSDNQRKFNQVRALGLIISAQREMITLSRPNLYFRSLQKWKKSHKSEEDKIKIPFEKHENDYNKMMGWIGLLRACSKDIDNAERTKTLEDDFIVKRQNQLDGSIKYELTENFHEMLEELESSYEQIYLLMLTNKIVSAGIEEDEELTYKQKEAEAVRRVVEA